MKRQRRPNRRNTQASPSSRPLRVENLEGRLMLAADIATFQNPFDANDVNNDQHVTPRDAIIVINRINSPDTYRDVVGGFIDVNDDKLISPHDALGVIDTLNNPETRKIRKTDKFDKLVVALESVPTTLDQDLGNIKDKLVATQKEMKEAHDLMRAELDDFLQFSLDQQEALEKRFEDLESSMDFSFTVMEREIKEMAAELDQIGTDDFADQEFDRWELDEGTIEDELVHLPVDPLYEPDFFADEFTWDLVEDLGDGLQELFADLTDVIADVEVIDPAELLTPELQGWLTDFDTGDHTLGDFIAEHVDTAAAEQWLLEGGDDVAALVDAMQADLAENETDFMEFVDDYFADDNAFIDMVDDLFGECVNGEMHHGDQVAIGGETTGSAVLVDNTTSFELDFHDDPELIQVAEAMHEKPVMIFGTLKKVPGIEIPERTIMHVKKIIPQKEFSDLTDKFKGYQDPMFGSLAGKFEDIYEDNVDHYREILASAGDLFSTLSK